MNVYHCIVFHALIAFTCATADEPATTDTPESRNAKSQHDDVSIHLVPCKAAFDVTTFGHDLEKMRQTSTYKAAVRYGVDVEKDLSGYMVTRHNGRSGFYLFHNIVRCEPKCHYMVQRIHKRISNYRTENGPPEISDLYLVEAFKHSGGQSKRPDQHFGNFSLGVFQRRVIEKTLEVGEVESGDEDESPMWPYDETKLGLLLQPYDPSREAFDQVRFRRSMTWTLRFEITRDGKFSLQVPELRIAISHQVPPMPAGGLALDQFSDRIQVSPGTGLGMLRLGSSEATIRNTMGNPLLAQDFTNARHLFYTPGMRLYLAPDKRLKMIQCYGDFPGQTDKGISIGDDRQKVIEAYGQPTDVDDKSHRMDGMRFDFDTDDQVRAIWVFTASQ